MLDDAATVVVLVLAASTLHVGRGFFFLDLFFLVCEQVQPYCVLTESICLKRTPLYVSNYISGT